MIQRGAPVRSCAQRCAILRRARYSSLSAHSSFGNDARFDHFASGHIQRLDDGQRLRQSILIAAYLLVQRCSKLLRGAMPASSL